MPAGVNNSRWKTGNNSSLSFWHACCKQGVLGKRIEGLLNAWGVMEIACWLNMDFLMGYGTSTLKFEFPYGYRFENMH